MNPFPPNSILRGCLVAGSLALLVGCATVKVKKVPTPTQYSTWTDQMQKEADALEGFRFYLPRPFLNVFESFPVRTDIYLADGVVTPDGKYVLITGVKPESELMGYEATIRTNITIKAENIVDNREQAAKAAGDAFKAQSEAIKEAVEAAAGAATGHTTVMTGGTSVTKEPSPAPPTTGVNKREVLNDNGAFAYQPMRGNMDIAYLPDFEEQYVISSRAGLGNAQFSLNLGQGWSLQGFNSLADNSELNKRIFDVIDESIRLAKAAAQVAAGIPPVDTAGLTELFKAQSSGVRSAEGKMTPASHVKLKIIVVHYAAKGLYPVIKPRELQERLSTNGSYYMYYDLFNIIPRQTPASTFNPEAIKASHQAITGETQRFTVPRYPYQYVSFNTFRYMVIEVIRTDAKPFEYLYDKTGTTGDPGDRQSTLPPLISPTNKSTVEGSSSAFTKIVGPFSVNGVTNAFRVTAVAEKPLKITVDAGSTKVPSSIEEIVASLKSLAAAKLWSEDMIQQIGTNAVVLTKAAEAQMKGDSVSVEADAAVDPVLQKLTDLTIQSGDSAADGFRFQESTMTDGVLQTTPIAVGNVKPNMTADQLAITLEEVLNERENLVEEVVLDPEVVEELIRTDLLKRD